MPSRSSRTAIASCFLSSASTPCSVSLVARSQSALNRRMLNSASRTVQFFFLKKPHRFRTSTRGGKESSHVRDVRSNVPGSSFRGNVSKYMWPLKLVFCSQRTNSSAMSGCTDPNMRPSSAASRVVPSLSCTPAKRRRFRARVCAAGGAHI